MKHVFVETNWVFNYAAPAHKRTPDAIALAEAAKAGNLKLYLPAVSLREGENAIRQKCQPKRDSANLRRFRLWAFAHKQIDQNTDDAVTKFLNIYDRATNRDLNDLETRINKIRSLSGVEVFGLSDAMLTKAIELRSLVGHLNPFDEAILAAILVKATELRTSVGPNDDFELCELDRDLAPFDKKGNPRKEFADLYKPLGISFRSDFNVT